MVEGSGVAFVVLLNSEFRCSHWYLFTHYTRESCHLVILNSEVADSTENLPFLASSR